MRVGDSGSRAVTMVVVDESANDAPKIQATSILGKPANAFQFDIKFLRKMIQEFTGVDPGPGAATTDLNEYFNKFGIQPVVVYDPKWTANNPVRVAKNGNTGTTGVNNGATVYTVTAGKTFYCTSAWLAGGGGGPFQVNLLNSSTCLLSAQLLTNTTAVFVAGEAPLFSVTAPASSVLNITVSGAGAGANNAGVAGWEE